MAKRAAKDPQLSVVGSDRPQLRRARKSEWTKAREKAFLTTLGQTCNVTLAAEAAGMSGTSAYNRRRTHAAFRAGWAEALSTAYRRLELVLLDRAFNGTEKVVKRRDGSEERMLEYSNQLAMSLLKMHRERATEAAPENEPDNIDEIRKRLFDKLERLRKREEIRRSRGE